VAASAWACSGDAIAQAFADEFALTFVASRTSTGKPIRQWRDSETWISVVGGATDEKTSQVTVDGSTKSVSVSKYATFALNFLEPDAASAALAWVRSEFDKTKEPFRPGSTRATRRPSARLS
jgi:hypothetical protein